MTRLCKVLVAGEQRHGKGLYRFGGGAPRPSPSDALSDERKQARERALAEPAHALEILAAHDQKGQDVRWWQAKGQYMRRQSA